VCHNLELADNAVAFLKMNAPEQWKRLKAKLAFKPGEARKWRDIRAKMYFNWDRKRNLLVQDDTFFEKPEEDLWRYADRQRPLCEIMPIERLMRVRLIRQSDVILLMFLLNDRFNRRQKQVAYNFYEPMTTHDSSLSYNTHSILAAELGWKDKAYRYFKKTCRLDLDDELGTTKHGIHGASLGGTWQSIVMGFGGARIRKETLSLNPILPDQWKRLAFKLQFRRRTIAVDMTHDATRVTLVKGRALTIRLNGRIKDLQ